MFQTAWNLAIYAAAGILLVASVLLKTNLTAVLALGIFIAWDVAYVFSATSFRGRTIDDAQQQVQNVREHMSYFLAFYGVLFGVLFTQGPDRQLQFVELCRAAGVPVALLVLPMVLGVLPLLFVPIRVAAADGHQPSLALKAVLAMTAFLQKSAIYLFLHVTLRILSALSG